MQGNAGIQKTVKILADILHTAQQNEKINWKKGLPNCSYRLKRRSSHCPLGASCQRLGVQSEQFVPFRITFQHIHLTEQVNVTVPLWTSNRVVNNYKGHCPY